MLLNTTVKLNIKAGTTGKSQADCLNILTGTSGLCRQDAWNAYAGTVRKSNQECANICAGYTDMTKRLLSMQEAVNLL